MRTIQSKPGVSDFVESASAAVDYELVGAGVRESGVGGLIAASRAANPPQPGRRRPGRQTLADRADLQALWDELIEKIGMVDFLEQLHPILVKNFGTHLSSGIPADRFERMVRAGLAAPKAFTQAAHDAYKEHPQQIPA